MALPGGYFGVSFCMSQAASILDPIHAGNVQVPTPEQLPDDSQILKHLLIEVIKTLRQDRLDKEALRHRLALLLKRVYGPRNERFHPDQLLLFAEFGQELAANDPGSNDPGSNDPGSSDPAAQAGYGPAANGKPGKRRCRPHGRGRLPENLPRRPLHHELCEAERICSCGQVRIDIGTDVSEQLDWQPASFFVWQHLLHKYACPNCRAEAPQSFESAEEAMTMPGPSPEEAANDTTPENTNNSPASNSPATTNAATTNAATTNAATTNVASLIGPAVISAAKPAMPIDKGLPGPGLLAHVIVSKYFDHLPLHRQEPIFARQGVPISRSTLCDWMAASAALLRPLYDKMVSTVLKSAWLHTDDTTVKNKGHAKGETALSRFWIYQGDRDHPYNVFDFTINRKRDGPQKFLADYRGYLHADAFSGYDALYLPSPRGEASPIIEVACNAHARRKFYDARGSDLLRSHQALAYFGQLYELERAATRIELDDDARLQMRRDLSLVILEQFHAWLVQERQQVLPKSPMAEAIGYALNNWQALCRYTEAGFLSIDNNAAEREMKRIAIGRKNWLFVGSQRGGQTAAVLFSFTSTCHRLGVEPWAYLQDVLARLPALLRRSDPERDEGLAELLPDHWQAARNQASASGATPASSTSPQQP
jgi:transposase